MPAEGDSTSRSGIPHNTVLCRKSGHLETWMTEPSCKRTLEQRKQSTGLTSSSRYARVEAGRKGQDLPKNPPGAPQGTRCDQAT